jgi:hypothetical protein
MRLASSRCCACNAVLLSILAYYFSVSLSVCACVCMYTCVCCVRVVFWPSLLQRLPSAQLVIASIDSAVAEGEPVRANASSPVRPSQRPLHFLDPACQADLRAGEDNAGRIHHAYRLLSTAFTELGPAGAGHLAAPDNNFKRLEPCLLTQRRRSPVMQAAEGCDEISGELWLLQQELAAQCKVNNLRKFALCAAVQNRGLLAAAERRASERREWQGLEAQYLAHFRGSGLTGRAKLLEQRDLNKIQREVKSLLSSMMREVDRVDRARLKREGVASRNLEKQLSKDQKVVRSCVNWMLREVEKRQPKRASRRLPDAELFCICQQSYDPDIFMIFCDACQEWFHGPCVKVDEDQASFFDKYVCPSCAAQTGQQTTLLPRDDVAQATRDERDEEHEESVVVALRRRGRTGRTQGWSFSAAYVDGIDKYHFSLV